MQKKVLRDISSKPFLRYNRLYQITRGAKIKRSFEAFYNLFERKEIEKAIEFFACFGGANDYFTVDITLDLIDNITSLLENYQTIKEHLSPQNEHLLAAFATGDRRLEATLKKSFTKESTGFEAFSQLQRYIQKEPSREKPPQKAHPKQKLKKELRRYRIQNKVRFTQPFFRFWYRFIYPNEELIFAKRFDEILTIILDDLENFVSLTFEELSNELLKERFKEHISSGSYWDRKVELDIYLELSNGQKVVGECKWKNSRICKKTLTSLQKKAQIAGIDADYYALFSKSGFSNELLKNRPANILLFDLEDFKEWSGQKAYKKSQKKPYSYEF